MNIFHPNNKHYPKRMVFIVFKNKKKIMPWLILAGIILIRGFTTGLNVISGLFLTPVSQELGVGIGTISLYFSVMSVVQVLWFGYAGKLLNRYDVRIVAGISAALQTLSFVAFGFMNNVWGWYLLAIPQAMGAAVLVNLLGPILINRWFPEKTGLMMGVQSACVGLLGAVLQPVTSQMIANSGWRSAYRVMGLVAFVVVLLAIVVFIKNRPASNETVPRVSKNQADENQISENPASNNQTSEARATRSGSFYALVMFMLALTGVAVFVQHISTYGNLLGYSVTQVGTAMSLSSLGTAIGALLIGFLADKIGGLKTCYVVVGLWILAVVGFMSSGVHPLIFAVSTFLNGVAVPCAMVISPILTLDFYGKENYEKIYAKVSIGSPLAAIFLVPIYGFLYDMTQSYFMVLCILIVLLVLAGASISYGWRKKESRE